MGNLPLGGLCGIALSLLASTPIAQSAHTREAALALGRGNGQHDVALVVPQGTPERYHLEVPVYGRQEVLVLDRHDLRAAGATVRMYGADGGMHAEQLPPSRTYRGTVLGAPGSTVLASLGERGWRVDVIDHPDGDWMLRPVESSTRSGAAVRHALSARDASPEEPLVCGVAEPLPAPGAPSRPGADGGESQEQVAGTGGLGTYTALDPQPFTCLNQAEIAFDADYEYFLLQGGTVAATIAQIDAHMNLVDFFYTRDARITYLITGYVVRTAPFYFPLDGNDLLDLFRTEWAANQAPILSYDIAHLMTDKDNIQYGGLASVGVVCNLASCYGWSLDSAGIIGHEVGHNWNAPHCLDPAPCNNMCGACLVIGPNTKDVIVAHRDSRQCLDVIGPYPTNVPPFAYPDRVAVLKNELLAVGSVSYDVLGNDEDGNCEPIVIAAFQATSDFGGTVLRSVGAGPAGRDLLVYTPPPGLFVGEDTFTYDVVDPRGGSTTGSAVFEVEPLLLEGYWKLDDSMVSSGAADSAGSFPGTYLGAPTVAQPPAPGLPGTSVDFDGINDLVRIPELRLNSNRVSFAAWIRRDGTQVPDAAIVFSNDGGTVAGLRLGAGHELRYAWNDDPVVESFASGLVVPDDTWTLVALVVEPDRATLYMGDMLGLSSAVHVHPHAPEEFDGPTVIANEAVTGRYFDGLMDDVRVFNYALSPSEVQGLTRGGAAYAPVPFDGGQLPAPASLLSWTPGTGGGTHDVYLGTDAVAVAMATTASPEYLGNVTTNQVTPGVLADDTTYFWRVDEVVGAEVLQGPLWQFELAERYRWKLDETSGTVAAECEDGLDGTYVNAPALGIPGATPSLGTAISLNGTTQEVQLPPLHLDSDRVTITGWFRRSGLQPPGAGLVYTRDANSVAGLHVGFANELRYNWNDDRDAWVWNSGLTLPDGEWAFAAVVVEPTQATMYMGTGGTLTSAVNVINHSPEEFDGLLLIGRDSMGSRIYAGQVDDVRVFDASLSPGQIGALYQSSL